MAIAACRRLFSAAIVVVLLALPRLCLGGEVVRIGVLSFRPLAFTGQEWRETAAYLDAAVPDHTFQMVPAYLDDLTRLVAGAQVDFVITNPEHFVLLKSRRGLAAIATLIPYAEGRPVDRFGGVIFTRAGNAAIHTLADLRGRRITAVAKESFGGYMAQAWTLREAGFGPAMVAGVRFTGQPHDQVVAEVLAGRADAGFVRTGVLESLAQEGKLRLEDVRVLNPQPPRLFPQRLSTDLYPEWPVAAVTGVPDGLVKAVSLALLRLPPDAAAARSGHYYGFGPPADYAPVEAVMLRLGVHPDRQFGLADIYAQYAASLRAVAALTVLVAALGGLWLLRTNRNLARLLEARAALEAQLLRANAELERRVTDRTREILAAKEEAEEARRHSELILATAGEGICGVDPDGMVSFVNPAARAMFGWDEDEGVGLDLHAATHHSHADGTPLPSSGCPVRQALAGGTTLHTPQEVYWRKDGTPFPVQLTASPIVQGGAAVGAVMVFRDVSEAVRTNRELRQKTEALARSNAELEQFAYVASHDLREPLRMIAAYVGLLERRYADRLDDDGRQFLAFAIDGARRMDHLVLDLLEYSRVGRGDAPAAPFDAGEALATALDNLAVAIAETNARLTLPEARPVLLGNPSEVTRLFQNLVANAIKYRRPGQTPEIRIEAARQGEFWRFAVSDDGVGIPPDAHERVFRLFQRLHTQSEVEGTGIGLALCKKIVEHHGGRLGLDSAPGSPTVFHFTLPAAPAGPH